VYVYGFRATGVLQRMGPPHGDGNYTPHFQVPAQLSAYVGSARAHDSRVVARRSSVAGISYYPLGGPANAALLPGLL